MTEHNVGTREEWLAARKELLVQEQEHAARSEELAEQRREFVPYYHQLLDRTAMGRVDEFRATRRDGYE